MNGELSPVAAVGTSSASSTKPVDSGSTVSNDSATDCAVERSDVAAMVRAPIAIVSHASTVSGAEALIASSTKTEGDWYERVYAEAGGDVSRVPWARCAPDPELLAFLADRACQYVRPGARSVVVGCGLGDDVAELRSRGFDAVGIDISPCAIDWARRRWPEHADAFRVADLCALSSCLCRRFDLVVEVHTLQSVPRDVSVKLADGLSRLVHPRGVVFGVWLAAESGTPLAADGPPWGFSAEEYASVMQGVGLQPMAPIMTAAHDHRARPRLSGVFGTGR